MASLEEQLAAEDARRKQRTAPAATGQVATEDARRQEVTASGLGKAGATGVRSGLEGIISAPADLVTWEKKKVAQLAKWMGASDDVVQKILTLGEDTAGPDLSSMTTPSIQSGTDAAVAALPAKISGPVQDITRHQPQNKPEEWAQTAGEFAPMVLGGPETLAAKGAEKLMTKAAPKVVQSIGRGVANVAAPAIATEGAGQTARAAGAPPGVENAIRIVTGFLSGGGLEHGMRVGLDRNIKAISDAGPEAVQSVFDNLKNQGMAPQDAVAKMRDMGLPGVDAMLLDTGSNTVQQAQNIQSAGGPGRSIIDTAMRERDPKINQGLETTLKGTVGPREQPSTMVTALEDRLTRASQDQKAAHAQQVQDVNLGSMADELDTQIASEKDPGLISKLQSVRKLLDQPIAEGDAAAKTETGSERVLKVRQAIKGMLYDAKGQLRDLNETEAGALKYYYGKVNEALDPANPTLRAADADIQQVKKEGEAFTTGQKVYENKPAHEGGITEVEFKQAFDKMTPGEQQAVMKGINVETWRQIGVNANDLTTLQKLVKGEGKWNHQKIASVFGEEKAQALMDAIGNAKQLRENFQSIVRGSKTAEATALTRLPQQRQGKLGSAIDQGLGMASPRLAHAKRFIQEMLAGGPALDPALSDQAARVLTLNDPDKIIKLAELMATRKGMSGGAGKPLLAALLARQQEVSNRKDQQR